MDRVKIIIVLVLISMGGLVAGCGNQQSGSEDNPMQQKSETDEIKNNEEEISLSGTLKDGVREIEMTAYQFAFNPDRLYLKKGEKVKMEVTSTDVTHGIAAPEMGIARRLPPGESIVIEFTPQEVGTYHFHCSVYCGTGHGRMHGEIVIVK